MEADGVAGGPVTRFERIPELFIVHYDAKFQAWGRNFQRVGARALFRFDVPVEPSPLMIDRRRIVGAILVAEMEKVAGRTVVTVKPLDEAAEEAIRRHVADLEKRRLN